MIGTWAFFSAGVLKGAMQSENDVLDDGIGGPLGFPWKKQIKNNKTYKVGPY